MYVHSKQLHLSAEYWYFDPKDVKSYYNWAKLWNTREPFFCATVYIHHSLFNIVLFLPRDASAERGYEIACRLSVRLSVCLSVCNV